MCANIAGRGFITFFYAIIDCTDGRKRCLYCNAGHNPPLLSRLDGGVYRLDVGGGVLGVFRDWKYEEYEEHFAAGDCMLLYTDGITEAQNSGDEFGENRLVDLLRDLQGIDAVDLVNRTIAATAEFANGIFEDDVTVVAVTVE
jgi:sigma-B regulation protein RsbU (phosphoserine phosphatase)